MAVPQITVQCAFGSNPGAASYSWTTIHNGGDVSTGKVRSVNYDRGAQSEFDNPQTGTGAAVLKDSLSAFDPDNTASPYYPNVVPLTPIRATALIGGVTYNLFQHFVERWPRTKRVTSNYTERQISTVDAFDLFANAGLAGQVFAAEASNVRVANVLDDIPWPAGLRTIGTGNSTVSAVTFADDDETKALNHLLDIAATSEEGLFYVDGSGAAVFVGRHDLLLSPYSVSQATFSDNPVGGEYGYVDLTPSYDRDHIINEWRGSRQGGTTVIVQQDAASQTKYLRRTDAFTSWVTDDTELNYQAGWRLGRTKDPLNRVESITVKPGSNTAMWQAVLGLDVGDRITVKETPPGFTVPKSGAYRIEHLDVQIPVGPVEDAAFTFQLTSADVNNYWILGVTGSSELGTTTRPAW